MIIDLFSGSGSASEPWVRDYPVFRYDLTEGWDLSEPLIQTQIIEYHKQSDQLLLIWASPPCVEYSRLRQTTGHEYDPDLTLWKAAQRIIAELEPRYHIIENVGGAVRSWGEPRQKVGPYYLWGDYPLISPPEVPPKQMHLGGGKSRAARAAAIPAALAERIKSTILSQSQLPPPRQL